MKCELLINEHSAAAVGIPIVSGRLFSCPEVLCTVFRGS